MRTQPKVATKTSMALVRKDKIRTALRNYPEGIFPKTLAFSIGENVNTVKAILRTMERQREVMRFEGLRGVYKLVEKCTHGLLSYNMHNIELKFSSEKLIVDKTVTEDNPLDDLIRFRFQIGKTTKQATMGISSDYPMNVTSLCVLAQHFMTLVDKHTRVKPNLEEIKVASIEFNKDHNDMRLEGLSCITLDRFIAQFKLYQREQGVREEIKITVPISLATLNELLKQGVTSAGVMELQQQMLNRLDRLEQSMNRFARGFGARFNPVH